MGDRKRERMNNEYKGDTQREKERTKILKSTHKEWKKEQTFQRRRRKRERKKKDYKGDT